MKNKKANKSSYTSLQWKVYTRIALISFAALIIVAVLSSLANQRAADWIVSFFENIFSLDFLSAQRIYLRAIRSNINYLTYLTFGIFFIIISRFLLMQLQNTLMK